MASITKEANPRLAKRPLKTNGRLANRGLTHWGRVTHICVNKLTVIGLDNGLSPDRRQAIIWTNAGILLIGTLGTNFSEIVIETRPFSFKKMHLKMSSGKWRPFCLGLNVLISLVKEATGLKAQCAQHNGRQIPAGYTNRNVISEKSMTLMTMSSNSYPWFRRKKYQWC